MITVANKMFNASGGSTHPCRRPLADIEPRREVSIIQLYASPHTIVENADDFDIGGATPNRAGTSHSSTQSTEWYDLVRSMKQIYGEAFFVHLSGYKPYVYISPPRRFSCPTLRRPPFSSSPACRFDFLLTHAYLQDAGFPRRCPETVKNSTASGLDYKNHHCQRCL